MLGLCMVLFLGGIQKIPPSLYDAARTDGAGRFRELVLVTIPGLRNEIAIAATLTVITALRGVRPDLRDDPGWSGRQPP